VVKKSNSGFCSPLLDASSPQVDDVIRIADDTLRRNGRIQTEHG